MMSTKKEYETAHADLDSDGEKGDKQEYEDYVQLDMGEENNDKFGEYDMEYHVKNYRDHDHNHTKQFITDHHNNEGGKMHEKHENHDHEKHRNHENHDHEHKHENHSETYTTKLMKQAKQSKMEQYDRPMNLVENKEDKKTHLGHNKNGNHHEHPEPREHEEHLEHVTHHEHVHGPEHEDMMEERVVLKSSTGIHSSIWLASLGSITVISLVGLVAVGVLPLLRGPYQEAVLQVLVSLAVGTLVGDSLIHLIPHAFGAEHGDTSVVWKGFTATMTIVAFFLLDRSMAAMGHEHSHGGGGHHHHRHDFKDGSTTDESRLSRESTPISRESTSTPLSRESTPISRDSALLSRESTPDIKEVKIPKLSVTSKTSSDDSGVEEGVEGVGSLYSLYRHSYHSLPPNDTHANHLEPGNYLKKCCAMPPSSLMVIVGDAVHNFADGLAIGAAFSLSLAAGFSTSVAVLCHELPHEVGDFALLLAQGMSPRTAIFYNLVSSIFAGLGLLVGLLLGSHEGLSSWLLSATVGVFLYVALVSMMTELQGGSFRQLFLNTTGMVGGAVLLLLIGLYEHDLILLFESNPTPHNH